MKVSLNLVLCGLFLFKIGFCEAQQQRLADKKYIFLLDITKSMFGCCGANNIFPEVRDHLISAIENIRDSRTEIAVYTYQEKIFDKWEVKATTEGKKELIKNLKSIDGDKVAGQNTDLLLAWNQVKNSLDRSKINIGFILTDGDHNAKGVPIENLYKEIERWPSNEFKDQSYIFVVDLVGFNIDKGIEARVNATPNAQIINGIEFFILEVKDQKQIVNTEDNLSFTLDLAKDSWDPKYDNIAFRLSSTSSNFTCSPSELRISELPAKVKLIPTKSIEEVKKELNPVSFLKVNIDYPATDYPQIKLLNQSLDIQVNNKKEKVLYMEVVD